MPYPYRSDLLENSPAFEEQMLAEAALKRAQANAISEAPYTFQEYGGQVSITPTTRERLNRDWAQALEEEKARLSDPRYLGAGINLDSPEQLQKEIFAPLQARYGIPGGHTSSRSVVDATAPKFIPRGNAIVKVDTRTGTAEEIYHGTPATQDITERTLAAQKSKLETQLAGLKFADPNALALGTLQGKMKTPAQLEAEWDSVSNQLDLYRKSKATGVTQPPEFNPLRRNPSFYFGENIETPIQKGALTIKGGQVASVPKSELSPGDIVKGYRFRGGDKSKKENWEKVQ